MAKGKCCWWCDKREVCELLPQLYNPIDRKWGYWFKATKNFNKDIFTAIAKNCKFYKLDKTYKEGHTKPSCW